MSQVFEIWVCSNCKSYYGASNAGDLSKKANTDNKNKIVGYRDGCQYCGGNRVKILAKEIMNE